MKKNFSAVILSVLIALTVFTCITLPVIAEESTPVTVLNVNGIDLLTADGNTVVCGSGSAAFDGKNTLTLTDAVIDSCYEVTDEDTAVVSRYGMFVVGDLDIVYSGSCSVDLLAKENAFALFAKGNLEVSGNGKLSLNSSNVPLYSAGSIKIDGKDTEISVEQGASSTDKNLCSSVFAANDIDIKDASVDIKAYSDALSANSLDLNNCAFTASAKAVSLNGNGIVNVKELNSEDTVFDCTGIGSAVTVRGGDATIDGGSFTAQAVAAESNPSYNGISVTGGTLKVKSGTFSASGNEAGAIVYSVFTSEDAAKAATPAIEISNALAITDGGEIKTSSNTFNTDDSFVVATSFTTSEISFIDGGDGSIIGGSVTVKIASASELGSESNSEEQSDALTDPVTDVVPSEEESSTVPTTEPTTIADVPNDTDTTVTTTVVYIDDVEPEVPVAEDDIIPIAQTGDNAAYWLIPLGAVAVVVIIVICITRKKSSAADDTQSDDEE